MNTGQASRVRHKKLLFKFAIVISVAVVIFCGQVLFRLYGPNSPVKTDTGTKVYETNIAGTEYRIPVDYFRYGIRPPKRYDIDLLIYGAFPDMQPLYAGSAVALSAEKGDSKDVVIIFISDAGATTSLQFRFGVEKKNYSPMEAGGEKFGLLEYISSKGPAGRVMEDGITVYSGMAHVANPSAEQRKGLLSEFYFDEEAESPSIFIVCDGDTAWPSPGCTQHFTANGLLFQVHYNKAHLKEWLSIKNNIVALMQHLAVPSEPKGDSR